MSRAVRVVAIVSMCTATVCSRCHCAVDIVLAMQCNIVKAIYSRLVPELRFEPRIL